MNKEEIKEILFRLEIVARKHTIEICDDGNIETIPASVVDELRLNNYSAKILLDYITNLEKELEELREDNYAYHQLMKIQNEREYRSKFLKEFQEEFGKNVFPDYDEIYKRYDKLKKENERLKKEIENLTHIVANKIIEDYDIDTPLKNQLNEERIKYINLGVVCNDYKSRNEKAIEYIKRHIQPDSFEGYLDSYEIKKTLNILQGVDKE